MQLIDFALLGLAVALPSPQVASYESICPSLDGAQVFVSDNKPYKLQCAKFIDATADQIIKTVKVETGYSECLDACEINVGCQAAQFIATSEAQQAGSCTLYTRGFTVREGSDNAWTVATRILPSDIPEDGEKFHLIVDNDGSLLNSVGVVANDGYLGLAGPQKASCDRPSNFATFFTQDGQLFLYGHSEVPQQVYVDPTPEGRGFTAYTRDGASISPTAERKGFYFNDLGYITFQALRGLACPLEDKSLGSQLWFSKGAGDFFYDCRSVILRPIKIDDPVSCVYT